MQVCPRLDLRDSPRSATGSTRTTRPRRTPAGTRSSDRHRDRRSRTSGQGAATRPRDRAAAPATPAPRAPRAVPTSTSPVRDVPQLVGDDRLDLGVRRLLEQRVVDDDATAVAESRHVCVQRRGATARVCDQDVVDLDAVLLGQLQQVTAQLAVSHRRELVEDRFHDQGVGERHDDHQGRCAQAPTTHHHVGPASCEADQHRQRHERRRWRSPRSPWPRRLPHDAHVRVESPFELTHRLRPRLRTAG